MRARPREGKCSAAHLSALLGYRRPRHAIGWAAIFKWLWCCLGPRIYRRLCRSGFDDDKTAAAVTQLLRTAWRRNIQVQKQFREFTINIWFIAIAI